MKTKKFVCKVCGYVHQGTSAPEICPVCKAPASEFMEIKEGGWLSNKNSNTYIIFYATVMVVIVATLLAVAALALKSRQDANILNEKKEAILSSLSAQQGQKYDDFVTAYAVDQSGAKVTSISGDEALQMLFDLKGAMANHTYPVFESHDGRVVLPVSGTGLWGPIWGYVALEKDMNTIVGVVFGHQGETPGLGAEIAGAKHWAMYPGKTIFEGDKFVAVTLRKGGVSQDNASHEVDAISGGTKTSDGVSQMLYGSLENYLPFLLSKRQTATPEVSAEEQQAVSNLEKVENNE